MFFLTAYCLWKGCVHSATVAEIVILKIHHYKNLLVMGNHIGMDSLWLLEVGALAKWFSWAHLFFGVQYLRAAL
jgi:hypothetical protein